VYLNNYPAPEKYFLSDTSPAPEKPGKYLKHLSGAAEVFIHTFPALEKCLYTLVWRMNESEDNK